MELAGFVALWWDVVRVQKAVTTEREELLGQLNAGLQALLHRTRNEADTIRSQSIGPLFPTSPTSPEVATRLLGRTLELAANSGIRAIAGLAEAVKHMHLEERVRRERAKQTLIVNYWALYLVGGGFMLQLAYIIALIWER
jgi:hypothetical protein